MSIMSSNNLRGAQKLICDWINDHSDTSHVFKPEDIQILDDGYSLSRYFPRGMWFYADEDLVFPQGLSETFLEQIYHIDILPCNKAKDWDIFSYFDPSKLNSLPKLPRLDYINCIYDINKCNIQQTIENLCKYAKKTPGLGQNKLKIQLYLSYHQKNDFELDLSRYNEKTYGCIQSLTLPESNVSKLVINSRYIESRQLLANFYSPQLKELYIMGRCKNTPKDHIQVSIINADLDCLKVNDQFKLEISNSRIKNLRDFLKIDSCRIDKRSKVKSGLTPVKYNGELLDMFCQPLHIGDWVISNKTAVSLSMPTISRIIDIKNEKIHVFDLNEYMAHSYEDRASGYLPDKLGHLPHQYVQDCDCIKIDITQFLLTDQSGFLKELIDNINNIINEYNQKQ